jgi:hypothetical protein
MDFVSIFLWVILIAAVPMAAAGLLIRRGALLQGRPFRRKMIGWGLIIGALLLALAAGYFFWTA